MVRSVLLAFMLCALATAPALSQVNLISIYSDVSGYNSYSDDAPTVHYAYVMANTVLGVSKVRYSVSTCLTSWLWLSDTNYFATTGESPTGVEIDFETCLLEAEVLLQQIMYYSDGTSPPNSSIWVEPHPDGDPDFPEALSYCSAPPPVPTVWLPVQPGAMCVGCEPTRFCGLSYDGYFFCPTCDGIPLPVEVRTWGGVKALYR